MDEIRKYFLEAIELETGKAIKNYANLIDFMEATEFPSSDELANSIHDAFEQLLAETTELNDRVSTLLKKEEA